MNERNKEKKYVYSNEAHLKWLSVVIRTIIIKMENILFYYYGYYLHFECFSDRNGNVVFIYK